MNNVFLNRIVFASVPVISYICYTKYQAYALKLRTDFLNKINSPLTSTEKEAYFLKEKFIDDELNRLKNIRMKQRKENNEFIDAERYLEEIDYRRKLGKPKGKF